MRLPTLYTGTERLEGFAWGYFVAANGIFLLRENDVFRANVKVSPEEVGLAPLQEVIELKNIQIPALWVHRGLQFFRTVYSKHGTEAFLWILRDPKSGEITLGCPTQRNETALVQADDDTEPSDSLKIGDWHSHPCRSFHSEGDIEDERHSDGIHIVVGDLDKPAPSFTASLVVRGVRKELSPADVLDLNFDFDQKWLDKVHPTSQRRAR
jgi:hypothetical protein